MIRFKVVPLMSPNFRKSGVRKEKSFDHSHNNTVNKHGHAGQGILT